jgi:uncharacterized SAM-binding protein YcdF (DUF218 family)
VRSAVVILLLVVLWAAGLLAFASRVDQSTPAADPPRADAIVALTGASDARITEAMKLLEDGKARRMLISGVNHQASRADIRGVARATRRYYDCCVDLGFQARNTVGNARETARWARAHGFTSLIVVTSDFHMPRAMLELKGAMPEGRFIAYPVVSRELDAHHWWRGGGGARRMIVEYNKFLAILFRQGLISLGAKTHQAAVAPLSATPGAKS